MPPQPELRHLRTFVAVAEELHFTRAAAKLHIAQQALSTQIRKLEATLGVQLFNRTTRRVELTQAGRTLLAHAVPLLAAASRAWDEVALAGAGEVGQISVSYAPTARREILPRILEAFHARHPGVEVHTVEVWWGNEAISENLADVALTRAPIRDDADIGSVSIADAALGVVLAEAHSLARGETVAVDRFTDEKLEITARAFSPGFYDLIVSSLQARGFSGPVDEFENLNSNFLLGDPAACAEIAAGRAFGIGFANQWSSFPPGLVWRAIEPELRMPMNMCWRRSARPVVQNFLAVALDVARTEGWLSEARRQAGERALAVS
jgi:DNA-binding transcriptional LysR family regulator